MKPYVRQVESKAPEELGPDISNTFYLCFLSVPMITRVCLADDSILEKDAGLDA